MFICTCDCCSLAEDVTSVATNLQQLNLQNSDEESLSEEDGPAVVIPDHLQVHTPDCQHLSFGSFGSGSGARTLKSNLAETQPVTDASSAAPSDTRSILQIKSIYFTSSFILWFETDSFLATQKYYGTLW